MENFLENFYWIGLMTLVTIYALFFDDIKLIFLPQSVDFTFDIITIICIVLYTIELVLGALAVDGYFLSFFFWVDGVSLISMLPDITFFVTYVEDFAAAGASDIAKTGRATKVVKIIRIIRLIRLLRVVKLYKQVQAS